MKHHRNNLLGMLQAVEAAQRMLVLGNQHQVYELTRLSELPD
jgi:hypothetical protein